jgi:anaerobic ribonucleoside-triphosphate reductase activating protein
MVPVYDGLTILGGDPMEPENTYEVYALIRRFKTEFPDKTVWLYTGYNFEDLIEGGKRMTTETEGVIQNCDVIVDGRFDIKLKDVRLNYRGSSNQRIIDVKESLKKKEVVTLDL